MNNEIFKIVGSVLLKDEEFIGGLKNVLEKAENTTQKISRKFQDVGKKISNAGKKMTVGLSAPIAGLVGLGAKYNIEMETLETNLGVLLGSTEKAHTKLEELRTMGAKTPFETTDLVKATQKMLAFGLDAEKTNGYLQMLGDIAMGDANKLDSLTLAFSQMGASGRASMEDINQMVDQGFNPLTYVCKVTGESMSEVRDRVSEGGVSFDEIASAMKVATSEGGAFFGSMDKASETTAGRISTLKDNFNVMVGKLTESLMPTAEKIVDKVAEWIDKFNSLDQSTKDMIVRILLVVATLGPVITIIGKIVSVIGTVITVFGKLKAVFIVVKTALMGLNMAFLASPITWIIAGIVALVAGFVLLWNKCEGFRNFWIGLWNGIVDVVSVVVNWIKNNWKSMLLFLVNPLAGIFKILYDNFGGFRKFIDNIVAGIKAAFDGIVLTIRIFIGIVVSIFDAAFKIITLPFMFIWENCKEYIINFVNSAKEIILNIVNWIIDKFNWLRDRIHEIFVWIKDNIIQPIQDAYNWLVNKIAEMVNWVVIKFNEFKAKVIEIFNNVKEAMTKPINDAKEKISEIVSAIKTNVSNVFNSIKTTISNVFNSVKNTVSNIWNGIMNAIKGPIEKARDLVKNAIDKIKGFFHFEFKWPKLKLPHFGITPKGWKTDDLLKGKIPKLAIDWYAKGAIFDKPTLFNSENGIKGVGEAGPEAVAPISELMKYTRLAVDGSNAGLEDKLNTLISLLSYYLPMLLERQMVLDTGELVGAISPEIDKRLGYINRDKERGN